MQERLEQQLDNYNKKISILGIENPWKIVISQKYNIAIIREFNKNIQGDIRVEIPSFVSAIGKGAFKGVKANIEIKNLANIIRIPSGAIYTERRRIKFIDDIVIDNRIDIGKGAFNDIEFNTLILSGNKTLRGTNHINKLVLDTDFVGDITIQKANELVCTDKQLRRYLERNLNNSENTTSMLRKLYIVVDSLKTTEQYELAYSLFIKLLKKKMENNVNFFGVLHKNNIREKDLHRFSDFEIS